MQQMPWAILLDKFERIDRPWKLVGLTVAWTILVALLDYILGSNLYLKIFFWSKNDEIVNPRGWSAYFYALVLILSLPSAFLLWYWRDKNSRDQINNQEKQLDLQEKQITQLVEQVKNQRKDTTIKEFQEVQRNSVGLFEADKFPQSACHQIQISALHQLTAFLKPDMDIGFRRAAFEILLNGHAEAMQKVGTHRIFELSQEKIEYDLIVQSVQNIYMSLDTVTIERINIIRDQKENLIRLGFPLSGRNFDLLDLSSLKAEGLNLDLSRSSFRGTNLRQSTLYLTNLTEAKFIYTELNGADLGNTNLFDSELVALHLENTNLGSANPKRIRHLESVFLYESTTFDDHLVGFTKAEQFDARKLWLDAGAQHNTSDSGIIDIRRY